MATGKVLVVEDDPKGKPDLTLLFQKPVDGGERVAAIESAIAGVSGS